MSRPTQRQIAAVVESARGDAEEHNNFAAVFRGRAIVALADDLDEARALLESDRRRRVSCQNSYDGLPSCSHVDSICWEHRRIAFLERTR